MKDPGRFAVLLMLIVSLSTITESQKPVTPKAKAPPVPVITCSDPSSALACKSFKELVVAHDKDIIRSLQLGRVLACFRPKEDAFFLVDYLLPPAKISPPAWSKPEGSSLFQAAGAGGLVPYTNGLEDPTRPWISSFGWWTAQSTMDQAPSYQGIIIGKEKESSFDINQDQVIVTNSFENSKGFKVAYLLRVRISTGRFTETFSFPTEANIDPLEVSGKCLVFDHGSLLH